MQSLRLRVVYKLDLTDRIRFGPIKKQILYERFTDGRISGLLAEDLANSLYNNLMKSPTEQSSYDIMDDEGNRYECRTITLRGANLIPSNQIGKGRQYDAEAHHKKVGSLHAYIFTDIRHSPIFYIVAIPVKQLGGAKRISTNQFDGLISDLEEIRL